MLQICTKKSLGDALPTALTLPLTFSAHAFGLPVWQEVFPDAQIEAVGGGPATVAISHGNTKIVSVAQRDLYRKYRWPAAPTITQHLELYKEEVMDK